MRLNKFYKLFKTNKYYGSKKDQMVLKITSW